MSGVSTLPRLEQLRRLLTRTRQEAAYAERRGLPIADLRVLERRVESAIEREVACTKPAPTADPEPVVTREVALLAELGVSAHDVKAWAVERGLLDTVRRGRVALQLVEAYAAWRTEGAPTVNDLPNGAVTS